MHTWDAIFDARMYERWTIKWDVTPSVNEDEEDEKMHKTWLRYGQEQIDTREWINADSFFGSSRVI